LLAETHIKAPGYPPGRLQLVRSAFPDDPAAGPALARIILDQVAAGERPATVRISRPGRVVAFGRRDTVSPGYPEAVAAMRQAGFRGMERLTGGRVAAHTEGTMVLAITTPQQAPAAGTSLRFRHGAELVRSALAGLGIDARTGAVPGEYCPGRWSVNAEGRVKLAGVGQRIIRGAAHVGFVIVAGGSEDLRRVLVPVHRALGLDWDPGTLGSVEDVRPGTTLGQVEAALLANLEQDARLEAGDLDRATLDQARREAGRFRPPEPEDPDRSAAGR